MPGSSVPGPDRNAGIIFAWHRIAALHPDRHRLCVTPEAFREQVALLRDHCTVLSLVDLLQAARTDSLPPNAVALTFDDGYLDALTAAAPILDGLPATFFVNTDRLAEPHEAWHDELERLLPGRAEQSEVHARLMPLGHRERQELLDRMWASSGLDRKSREDHRVLLADEVLRLSRLPGCRIGSHSANHLYLPVHPPEVQHEEVRRAREELEALLDRPVSAFAYPFGGHDAESVAAVRDAGHLVAVTVEPGRVTSESDGLLLPRIEVSDLSSLLSHLPNRRP